MVIDSSCKLIQVAETYIENLVGQKIDKLDLKNKTQGNSDENISIKQSYEEVQIDETNLTSDQIQQVRDLLKSKAQAFAKKNEPPTQAINISHNIDTGSNKPINSPKYRVSHKERPIIQEHIKEMLKNNVIEPSKSPWASPIVLVPKKEP